MGTFVVAQRKHVWQQVAECVGGDTSGIHPSLKDPPVRSGILSAFRPWSDRGDGSEKVSTATRASFGERLLPRAAGCCHLANCSDIWQLVKSSAGVFRNIALRLSIAGAYSCTCLSCFGPRWYEADATSKTAFGSRETPVWWASDSSHVAFGEWYAGELILWRLIPFCLPSKDISRLIMIRV